MNPRHLLMSVAGCLAAILAASSQPALAQDQPALAGQVTSEAEGAMEGVVVTAKKAGWPVTVSVITDAKGHYQFPAGRLGPGKYSLAIRAVGYDPVSPVSADVAEDHTATADIKLKKTRKLASQLSNAEWMMSIPGTEQEKSFLLNCNSCHTLERIVRSTHDEEEWTQVISRMSGYGPVSQPIKPQRMLDTSRIRDPATLHKPAKYLASINLSQADQWPYALKTLPRPKGRATHVIITEYQLPRPTIEPHDVVVDKDGTVWFSDFGEMFISKYDPKTLKLTEYPVKQIKKDAPVGNLSLDFDKAGTLWFDTMFQGEIGNIDPKTGKMTLYPLPPELNTVKVQLNFIGLRHDVDGKVWTKSVGTQTIFRLDLKSGKWEGFQPLTSLPGGQHSVYQVISDSQNNLWMAEFREGHIGEIEAKTGKVTWFDLPTKNARARRMNIDDQDRIWVTEYRGNKVAMFNTKTHEVKEYPAPPYTFPYRAAVDKNGDIWTGGMHTDRAVRINPKTGETVEYLLPTETNMRTVFVDNSTTPVTFWTGSNHQAALVKVEPLD